MSMARLCTADHATGRPDGSLVGLDGCPMGGSPSRLVVMHACPAQDVCAKAQGGQSHTAHRVVAFEPYAPAALFLRIAVTLLVIRSDHVRPPHALHVDMPALPAPAAVSKTWHVAVRCLVFWDARTTFLAAKIGWL